ncbi:right-handed parallel beta-helix repeat-containing protein [uncultured Ilyobacter sp.]|uniref:right-handed parallel beta-helix repeat-containing protein n=1 Tax=uncultured Ilyobacter sp. TaxID=544433 RepID=UPI0029C8CA63|nr:right-handed parallel beta-helix repeat-containing protein [uncultured Ilyobacter sp.]
MKSFINKKYFKLIITFVFFITFSVSSISDDFFVSPRGSDLNPGTKEEPFKTPEKARDTIREKNLNKKETVVIWFFGGRYFRKESFKLEEKDSGSKKAPIVYKGLPGETVYWDGGDILEKYEPISEKDILNRIYSKDRKNIFQITLDNFQGENMGSYGPRGFGRKEFPAPAELFINGIPQTIARWPNHGRVPLGTVVDKGSTPRWGDPTNRGAVFKYEIFRPELWTQAKDAYIGGIFSESYADDSIKISKIDTDEKTITMSEPHLYGFNNKPYTSWYISNLLEEIDIPGEYYIEKENKKIYFYPSTDDVKLIQLSQLDTPLVVMENASHIKFENIIFENSRGMGIVIKNGDNNTIAGCVIRLIGGVGVDVSGGMNHSIVSSDIYYTGAGGVSLSGGDRKSLTPSNHMVKNCDIHNVNRWYKTYRPCVNLDGVGQKVLNNHLHDVPGQAILFYGNDHLIEYNEINNCVTDMSDMAAIYTGRDPSVLGHVIRYNFFHHLENKIGSGNGVQSIYFDDDNLYTGIIYGNVFYRAGSNAVIHFNGGGSSSIGNNIFIDCPKVIWGGENERVLSAIRKMHDIRYKNIQKRIFENVDIRKEPFKSRYPYLLKSYESEYNIGTPMWNNVVISSKEKELMSQFVNPEEMNFKLKSNSKILKLKSEKVVDPVYGLDNQEVKFKDIPFEKIGIYKDKYRGSIAR